MNASSTGGGGVVRTCIHSLACSFTWVQIEGCTSAEWHAHRAVLKQGFSRLVNQAKAQRRAQLAGQRQEQGSRDGEDNGKAEGALDDGGAVSVASSSSSTDSPCAESTRQLKPTSAIVSLIKSELCLSDSTTTSEAVSRGISDLGMEVDETMTMEDKIFRVARELNISVTDTDDEGRE